MSGISPPLNAGPDAATRTAKGEDLIALARGKAPEDRERLMLALAKLCDLPEAGASDRAKSVIEDLFLSLIAGAERSIRLHLAEILAPARWAPSALINALALDDIEIARPIIAMSPVLTDADLLRLLVVATLEHQIEIARRPAIGEQVVDQIISTGDPATLAALAGNPTAEVSSDAMASLVAASQRIAALRSPLARHPRLNRELAQLLYTWVGQTLQKELSAGSSSTRRR